MSGGACSPGSGWRGPAADVPSEPRPTSGIEAAPQPDRALPTCRMNPRPGTVDGLW